MIKFKRILVPVDFSEEARVALENAIQLAKKNRGVKIYLIHALPFVHAIDYPGPLLKDMAKHVKRQEESVKADLDEWRKKIPDDISSDSIVTRGHAGTCILKICQKKLIDLVVMTTHGRCGVKRWTHPNLTEKIVRLSRCPILVFHLKPLKGKARV